MLNFLAKIWLREDPEQFDITLLSRVVNDIVDHLTINRSVSPPFLINIFYQDVMLELSQVYTEVKHHRRVSGAGKALLGGFTCLSA